MADVSPAGSNTEMVSFIPAETIPCAGDVLVLHQKMVWEEGTEMLQEGCEVLLCSVVTLYCVSPVKRP